jgi:uncharacterized protein involved in response to NO
MNLIKTFTATPHRMFFFGGVMQSVLIMLWWLIDLGGRYGGWYAPISWSVAPPDAHAFLMLFGFFPFFMFGFLMTVYPRWMNGEEVEPRLYIRAFVSMASGIVLFYAGLVVKPLLALAALLFLGGWVVGLYALLRVYFRAQHPDKRHASITSAVLGIGWLLTLAWFVGELGEHPALVALAKTGGVWLLLLPVFFSVSHRMIPFFSSNVIPNYQIVRPYWALGLVVLGVLLHAVMELNGATSWLWLVDFPMAMTAIYLTVSWRLIDSLKVPLLGMLHIGFAWLGVAFALFGAQSLALMLGYSILGKAPLHALALGYYASMTLAMVTRVTLGHSGRPLVADRVVWGLFLVFQLVVLLRVAAELPGVGFLARSHLFLCAAGLWLACFSLWARRFAVMYWLPRSDGKPG